MELGVVVVERTLTKDIRVKNKPCSVEKGSAPRGEEGKRGNMRGNTQQVCFPKEVVDGLKKKSVNGFAGVCCLLKVILHRY